MKTAISARICGNDYTCQIHREDLRFFEALHGPAFSLLNHIRQGAWSVDQLKAIIDFSLAPRPKSDGAFDLWVVRERLAVSRNPETVASRAFVEKGPAAYVLLAIGILTAALVGVTEDLDTFSDETSDHGEE